MASGDYRVERKERGEEGGGGQKTVRRWQKVIHVFRRFFSTIDFQICPLDAPSRISSRRSIRMRNGNGPPIYYWTVPARSHEDLTPQLSKLPTFKQMEMVIWPNYETSTSTRTPRHLPSFRWWRSLFVNDVNEALFVSGKRRNFQSCRSTSTTTNGRRERIARSEQKPKYETIGYIGCYLLTVTRWRSS